ncbi:MAG: DegQ family serine endoprotease [Pseudomonadota bacterium]
MFKAISKSITPVLKWGTVIATTAIVVISIQGYADDHNRPAEIIPAAQITPLDMEQQSWSPSHGFADLIERVSPAVVHVAISGVPRSRQRSPEFNFPPGSPFEDFFEQFRNRQQPEREQRSRPLGIGSGFIISADGYVVTNNHVIKDADEIVVTMTDGTEYIAELKGSDNKTDLALLKLEDAENLPYVPFGNDEQSRVGDWVVAIGNPFGLGGSASTGIISARGRDIRSGPYDDYIQVDAAINRGNSGGPLFNLRGEVIGINTAIYSPNGGSVGIGFSIPSSLAENVISQLRETGEVERAWIGVEIQALSTDLAEGFGRDDDHGALVSNVTPNQPADKAGIRAGDIILSYNGEAIKEMRDLPRVVAQSSVGEKYPVEVWRNGGKKTLTIRTERYPDDDALAALGRGFTPEEAEPESDAVLGAQLSSITDELRDRYDIDEDLEGAVVVSVDREGLAASNGIRTGDVITSVNNRSVDSPTEVVDEISAAQAAERSTIVVLLQRNGNSRFIPFNLEDE